VTFQQPDSPYADPKEIATLIVNGMRFSDWETVWVQHRFGDGHPTFRFTCAERDPIPNLWSKLQFLPGNEVDIELGGMPAIKGIIIVRQTAYDANNHGVSLQGVGLTWYLSIASIIDKKQNFEGSYMDIANQVLKPTGIKAVPVGNVDGTPFDGGAQSIPGETIWAFLERYAKDRKIILSGDQQGNLLVIGENTPPVGAQVKEGVNIISCQAIIDAQGIRSEYFCRGQCKGSDKKNMTGSSEQEATPIPGTAKRYAPLLTVMEQPVWTEHEVNLRNKFEASVWHEGTLIQVTVVVPGWFQPDGALIWMAGQIVQFDSPMTTLVMPLGVRSATFTQDRQSGTRTTLELVAPWALNSAGIAAPAGAPVDPNESIGTGPSATSGSPA
jgi:prophage tail gpP-like protein